MSHTELIQLTDDQLHAYATACARHGEIEPCCDTWLNSFADGYLWYNDTTIHSTHMAKMA